MNSLPYSNSLAKLLSEFDMASAANFILFSGIISSMILSLLGINRLWIYLGLAAFALTAALTTYYVWKSSVERAALLEFNRAQLEKTVRDQEEFRRRQEALEEQQREATRALIEQNRDVQRRVQSIQGNLNSPEAAAADRPASDILKRTIEQLREIR